MKNKSKILPVKYPPITTIFYYAYPISVLSNHDYMMPWIYNNCVQLYTIFEFIPRFRMFEGGIENKCPWITRNDFEFDIVKDKYPSILPLLENCIDNNFYIHAYIDVSCIKQYNRTTPFRHNAFIYGYDRERQIFNYGEFISGSKFTFLEVSYGDMEKAFRLYHDESWGLILFRLDYKQRFHFDIDLVIHQLRDYINSTDTTVLYTDIREAPQYVFGLKNYDIPLMLLGKIAKEEDGGRVNILGYQVIYEHKKIMKMLIQYLHKRGFLLRGDYFYHALQKLEDLALIIRNGALKYMLTGNRNVRAVINNIKKLAEMESELFKELLECIRPNEDYKIRTSQGKIKSSNINITYSDGWQNGNEYDRGLFTDETKVAYGLNEYAETVFYGSSVRYMASKNNKCGMADIYIDGEKCETINLFSTETVSNEIIYENNNLACGYHVIRIQNAEYKDNKDSNSLITLYGLEFENDDEPKSTITFLGVDKETKGDWPHKYGNKGYEIFGQPEASEKPLHVKYLCERGEYSIFTDNIDETMICTDRSCEKRSITSGYSTEVYPIEVGMLLFEGKVSFYLADWDNQKRRVVRIEAIDNNTGEVLDTRYIGENDDYKQRIYISYHVKGNVKFRFTNTEGNFDSVVLGGVFWD